MATAIRDVHPEELPRILELNEAAVPNVNSVDLEQMRKFSAEAACFRVALVDDELAGFLIGLTPDADYMSPNFRWFCANYIRFAYIDRIAVAGHARRHGLGRALYRDFEIRVGGAQERLACEVNLRPPNEASMAFHRRMGFRQVGSQVIDAGNKEVAMLVKELSP